MTDAEGSARQWITRYVERVIASFNEKGEDPSTKTLYIDNPRVSLDEGRAIARKFHGRIRVLLWPNGVPLPCLKFGTTPAPTRAKSSG